MKNKIIYAVFLVTAIIGIILMNNIQVDASVLFMGVPPVVFTEGLCPNIQKSLVEVFANKAPELARTKVGYLDAIVSPQNTASVSFNPFPSTTGKTRTVRLTYIKRGCESEIVNTPPVCDSDPTIEDEPFEKDYDITQYIGSPVIKFTEDEMRKLCGTDQEWITKNIMSKMDPIITSLDKSLLAIQAANFGAFNPAIPAGYMDVDMVYGARNEPLYYGEMSILSAFEQLNVSERPLLIGKGKLYEYAMQQKIGCCNEAGLNMQMAGNFDYYYDRFAGTILGNEDYFIGLAPGRVQLLTWNKYKGEYVKNNDVFQHGTIVDPFTGIEFDMKVWYDYKCEYFAMQFGLYYELVFLPDDAFAYCDELAGVNYTLQFKANKAS